MRGLHDIIFNATAPSLKHYLPHHHEIRVFQQSFPSFPNARNEVIIAAPLPNRRLKNRISSSRWRKLKATSLHLRQILLPDFILGMNRSWIFCAWPIWREITCYLGSFTVISTLSIDGQLNTRMTNECLTTLGNTCKQSWRRLVLRPWSTHAVISPVQTGSFLSIQTCLVYALAFQCLFK